MIDSLEQVMASGRSTKAEKAELLIDLSYAYLFADTAKCRAYAMDALQLTQNYGLKSSEAKAYNLLGNFYNVNMMPFQAHAHYTKAERIYLELDDRDRLFVIYYNMKIMFRRIREYENAEYYANKALSLNTTEQKGWWPLILSKQLIHGEARFRENYSQEALDYFLDLHHKALHIEDSLGIIRETSSLAASRCAEIYANMNRPHEALPYYHQALDFFKSRGNKPNIGRMYAFFAMTYALMHHIDSTEHYINKALDYHKTTAFDIHLLYHACAKIDSLKGNYLSALANFQKYHHVSDSLSKEEKTTEMARLKLWHEFDHKESEKKILQQEFLKQRKLTMILTVSLMMTLALLAIAVFFYRKITEKNREITEKNHAMEDLHSAKDKLFSVMAHDLRSPIASLMSVLKLTHSEELDIGTQVQLLKDVSKRVDDVLGLLDNLLRWAKNQMQGIIPMPVYLDAQKESLTVTDSLQDIAANKQIVLENRIERQQIYADRDMFAVVVRNLTANAIKYTFAEGRVILASELSDDMLTVSVKDNGTGMTQDVQDTLFKLSETRIRKGTDNESGTGLGLVLCADFVKANGGNIWYTSAPKEGSTFFFSVPAGKH